MSSFLEKLKKGMGIEVSENEGPEDKPEEESGEKLVAESEINTEEEKSPPKRKRINLARKGKDFTQPPQKAGLSNGVKKISIETQVEEPLPKKGKEEKIEEKVIETDRQDFSPQKLDEKIHPNFALQSLGGQEGQLTVDVYQTDRELIIQSAIAGVRPEDLDISIENDVVLIRGDREKPPEDKEINYFYQECYWGPFSRKIILPEEVDPSRAEATMKQGILTIRMPKIEREKKRKISIKS